MRQAEFSTVPLDFAGEYPSRGDVGGACGAALIRAFGLRMQPQMCSQLGCSRAGDTELCRVESSLRSDHAVVRLREAGTWKPGLGVDGEKNLASRSTRLRE